MTSRGIGGTQTGAAAAGGSGRSTPHVGWKDYVDARIEASKATSDSALSRIESAFARMEGKFGQMQGRFDSLPSTLNFVVLLTSYLAAGLLVLALLANYFGVGLSTAQIARQIQDAQSEQAAIQKEMLTEMRVMIAQMHDQLQSPATTSRNGGE